MIAIDTNIVIRLLTGDDPVQLAACKKLFQHEGIFIPITAVLESEWVLRHAYQFDANTITHALSALLGLPNIMCENSAVVAQAIKWHKSGMDFADAIHLAKSQHCHALVTFDKKLIKLASQLTAFEVKTP